MNQTNRDRANWIGVCLLVIGIVSANKYYNWNLFDMPWSLFDMHWSLFDMHRLDLHWGVPVQIFTWPIIFIVVGLVLLLLRRGVGLLLIFIGAFFYFTNEFIWAISHLHEWWPVALIIVGVLILAKSTSAKRVNN